MLVYLVFCLVALINVSLVVFVVSKSISMLSSKSSPAVSTPALRQLAGIDLLFFVGGFVIGLLSVVAVLDVRFHEAEDKIISTLKTDTKK